MKLDERLFLDAESSCSHKNDSVPPCNFASVRRAKNTADVRVLYFLCQVVSVKFVRMCK